MDDPRSVIERSLTRVESESYTLESFYRRRDRKRTRQRLTAGIVGLAIAIMLALAGSAMIRSASERSPADTKGTPVLRDGEVLQVLDPFSPAATMIATDPATGHQRILHGCSGRCGWIQEFNPSTDGGWIAWEESCGSAGCEATEGGLWVAGGDGSTIPVTSSVHPPDPLGGWIWAWSPAADQLAFATGRPGLAELVLFDPATGERTSLTTVEGISALSWSPDGTAIAIAIPSSGVSIIDLATGHSTSIARIGTIEDHGLSWSPDGARLALAPHGRIIVVGADGSDRRILVGHGASPGPDGAWSPDGTRIAYVRTPGSARGVSLEVWVIGADGSDPTRLFQGECCLGDLWWGPIWSPDGHRIAFFDGVAVSFGSELTVNADGSGSPKVVDDVVVDGWIQA
jgi:dipeptidyl aminopeptidase/acylaminoacyl peptidase